MTDKVTAETTEEGSYSVFPFFGRVQIGKYTTTVTHALNGQSDRTEKSVGDPSAPDDQPPTADVRQHWKRSADQSETTKNSGVYGFGVTLTRTPETMSRENNSYNYEYHSTDPAESGGRTITETTSTVESIRNGEGQETNTDYFCDSYAPIGEEPVCGPPVVTIEPIGNNASSPAPQPKKPATRPTGPAGAINAEASLPQGGSGQDPATPAPPPTAQQPPRSWLGWAADGLSAAGSFVYDTAANYPHFLGRQTQAAANAVTENGRAAGEFIGDHGSQLYYDPADELSRIQEGANAVVEGTKAAASEIAKDPLGAAANAVGQAADYADRLTSDPEASGQLLGDGATSVATGAAGGAAGKVVGKGITTVAKFGKGRKVSVPDLPDAPKTLPVPANLGKNIHAGAQGKHIPGHNDFIPGRSTINNGVDPQALLDGVHSGRYPVVGTGSRGNPIVDFGKDIGVDASSGLPTRFGQIHTGKNGSHIVPQNPNTIN